MKKSEIQKIKITINAGKDSVLAMEMFRDGSLTRQGNGQLPRETFVALGMTDGAIFRKLVELLDEQVLAHAAIYDQPDKRGMPLVYQIAFIGEKPLVAFFEFRVGTDSPNPGGYLPYFDGYIGKAVSLTEKWYQQAKVKSSPEAEPPQRGSQTVVESVVNRISLPPNRSTPTQRRG